MELVWFVFHNCFTTAQETFFNACDRVGWSSLRSWIMSFGQRITKAIWILAVHSLYCLSPYLIQLVGFLMNSYADLTRIACKHRWQSSPEASIKKLVEIGNVDGVELAGWIVRTSFVLFPMYRAESEDDSSKINRRHPFPIDIGEDCCRLWRF